MSKLNSFIKNLPYASMVVTNDELLELNKKFLLFDDASLSKDEKIQRLSIINQFDNPYNLAEYYSQLGQVGQNFYSNFVYGLNTTDKAKRLEDYRAMGNSPEVEMALREICDEFLVEDDNNQFIKMRIDGKYGEEVESIIQDEFKGFIKIFDFKNKGWGYMWDFLVEGEKFWENIVSIKKPELGIIGVTQLDAARIDPIYSDKKNELIDVYVIRKKIGEDEGSNRKAPMSAWHQNQRQDQMLFLNDKQITYVHSGRWDEKYKIRLPHVDYGRRPYKQLNLIEDATVIYMLVRAPERLVFNIATGNMPPAQSEQYLKKQMAQYLTRKTVGASGKPENVYDPQSMLENYFFSKPANGEGSTVTTVGGGNANPDNLEILLYFVKKLYGCLHVPLKRLDSDTGFSDGVDISREELRFAKLIMDMQRKFASAIKSTFITHLKFRGRKIQDVSKYIRTESARHFIRANHGFFSTQSDWQHYSDYVVELNRALEGRYSKVIEELNTARFEMEDLLLELDSHNGQDVIIENATAHEADKIVLEAQIDQLRDKINSLEDEVYTLEGSTKSYWEQYELRDEDIELEFNIPTSFFALREQQALQLKIETFQSVADIDLFSTTYAMKKYLELSDREIAAIREFARKDAAIRWELAQIEQSGPHFRELMKQEMAQLQAGGDMGLGGGMDEGPGMGLGGDMGGGMGDDTALPEFGDAGGIGGGEDSEAEEPATANDSESPEEP